MYGPGLVVAESVRKLWRLILQALFFTIKSENSENIRHVLKSYKFHYCFYIVYVLHFTLSYE